MGRVVLSTGLAGMSGRVGDLVLEQRAGGTVAKAYLVGRRRRTPRQEENEARLAGVSLAWHALDDEGFAAWRALASASAARNPATGAWVTPNPYNLFCKYAGKVRQVDPGASLAGFRPAGSPFGGDGVNVVAQASLPEGSELAGMEARPLPLPPLQDKPLGEGVLRFSADRANAEGVVTELLSQPLVNARRRVYGGRYVSRGFVAFAGAGEAVAVPLAAGAWACAYRFVRPATGQETAIFELGVVEVTA